MKHWNFFPCLFALCGFIYFCETEIRLEKLNIPQPNLSVPFNFAIPFPDLIIPPQKQPDSKTRQSADGSESHQPNGILKSS